MKKSLFAAALLSLALAACGGADKAADTAASAASNAMDAAASAADAAASAAGRLCTCGLCVVFRLGDGDFDCQSGHDVESAEFCFGCDRCGQFDLLGIV